MSRSTLKNYWAESQLFNRRVIIAIIFMCVLLFILLWRLWDLQIFDRETYITLSNENHLDLIPIDPNRGLIYDRNGALLAENITILSLDVIPNRAPNFKQSLEELQKIITITDDEMKQFKKSLRQRRSSEGVSIKLNLTEREAALFYVNQYRFPGFSITGRLMRYYPHGEAMVTALGYVGRINEEELKKIDEASYAASKYIGKMGIERFYEDRLHGKVGYQQVETDAGGRVVQTLKYSPPLSGDSLYTTLDLGLQEAAEEALGEDQGAVVAIDPKTGEVLAFVSNPRYDPNLFVSGISQQDYTALRDNPDRPLYNRLLRGLYPPGSTVKPFLGAQILDTGVVTPAFTLYDNGFFKLPRSSQVFKDWNWRNGGHGRVNLREAIIESCDVYFYTVAGMKLGIARIGDILQRFGFGQKTGLDVQEELPGVVPSPEWKRRVMKQGWYPGDTINTSIGQGFTLVTPLQLAVATATLANRGVGYDPRFAKTWKKLDGTVEEVPSKAKSPVILNDNQTWDFIISAMQGVTQDPHGTARGMSVNTPYTIAAKTGTAQVYRPLSYGDKDGDHIPSKYRSHSWLIAFAPVEDPKIALAVLVEHHPGQAPIVTKKVLDYYLLPNHGVVEPVGDEGQIILEPPRIGDKLKKLLEKQAKSRGEGG